jgi:hypothetical protein
VGKKGSSYGLGDFVNDLLGGGSDRGHTNKKGNTGYNKHTNPRAGDNHAPGYKSNSRKSD